MSAIAGSACRLAEFGQRSSVAVVEEGVILAPTFDSCGLIPLVTTDVASGDVLMVGAIRGSSMETSQIPRSFEPRGAFDESRLRLRHRYGLHL
jgi:hypothetical protein